MINCRLIALSIFLIWGCGEEATDSEPVEEEKKVVTDDPASPSASEEHSPDKTVAPSPKDNNPTPPKGCPSDGRLCLIVSLDNDRGFFQVRAVIKEGNRVARNAQGDVIFSLTRIRDDGEIDGFCDAEGECHETLEDASDTLMPVAVTNGEAVLYDTEIDFPTFSTEVDKNFVLKAQYEETTVKREACQTSEGVTFDCLNGS